MFLLFLYSGKSPNTQRVGCSSMFILFLDSCKSPDNARAPRERVHTNGVTSKIFFHTPCAKCYFAHARAKQRALNQALHTSYEKIVFDTRVRKWFYPRMTFSPSLRSGANVPTRIKSLFRTCIENNYNKILELNGKIFFKRSMRNSPFRACFACAKVAHAQSQINLLSRTPCVKQLLWIDTKRRFIRPFNFTKLYKTIGFRTFYANNLYCYIHFSYIHFYIFTHFHTFKKLKFFFWKFSHVFVGIQQQG